MEKVLQEAQPVHHPPAAPGREGTRGQELRTQDDPAAPAGTSGVPFAPPHGALHRGGIALTLQVPQGTQPQHLPHVPHAQHGLGGQPEPAQMSQNGSVQCVRQLPMHAAHHQPVASLGMVQRVAPGDARCCYGAQHGQGGFVHNPMHADGMHAPHREQGEAQMLAIRVHAQQMSAADVHGGNAQLHIMAPSGVNVAHASMQPGWPGGFDAANATGSAPSHYGVPRRMGQGTAACASHADAGVEPCRGPMRGEPFPGPCGEVNPAFSGAPCNGVSAAPPAMRAAGVVAGADPGQPQHAHGPAMFHPAQHAVHGWRESGGDSQTASGWGAQGHMHAHVHEAGDFAVNGNGNDAGQAYVGSVEHRGGVHAVNACVTAADERSQTQARLVSPVPMEAPPGYGGASG